jgi:hypothetical protein
MSRASGSRTCTASIILAVNARFGERIASGALLQLRKIRTRNGGTAVTQYGPISDSRCNMPDIWRAGLTKERP